MKRPYLILTVLFCCVFVYLILTDVVGRYSKTWELYSNLVHRKKSILDPTTLTIKKARLKAELDSLSASMLQAERGYLQNEIGVFQCVTDNARRDNSMLRSFSPGKERNVGQFREFEFEFSVEAQFEQVGVLINNLENESIPIDLKEVDMISNPIGIPNLKTSIKGQAFLYNDGR